MSTHSRSTEAPMDFQFTSRPNSNAKPVWAASNDDQNTPRKRPFNDLNPATPAFPSSPLTPMFGENHNVPFIFQSPAPHTNPPHAWAPPPNFSPQKAFPPAEELRDVDMAEASPPKPDTVEATGSRAVATGAMRRVYNWRQKARVIARSRQEDAGYPSEDDSDDDRPHVGPLTQNTSNHYTLNMPSAPAAQSDTPYVLLGYLQFFFNLSLVLVFLYLLIQFIFTVQRDVEHRISEYSMDIVQEIGVCAAQYRNNFCESNQIPAMTHQCAAWETCMNRDPTTVGRARVGAELIAEVVNGFVEPISWKTMASSFFSLMNLSNESFLCYDIGMLTLLGECIQAFSLTSLSFLTLFVNSLLSLYRSRHQPAQSPPSYPVAPVPPFHTAYLPLGSSSDVSQKGKMDISSEDAPRRRRLEGGQAVKVK